jgi:hypothetical protein
MLINHRRRRIATSINSGIVEYIDLSTRGWGHLDAPTMMLAERAADHILGRGLLPAEPAPFYVALNRQSAQR